MRRAGVFTFFFVLVASALQLVEAPLARAEPFLPSGFSVVGTDTGQGQFNLTDFTFLPSGGMLTTGKNGLITHVEVDGTISVVARIPATSEGDLGLLGIAVATDYATSGRVYGTYTYRTINGTVARLVAWTVDNPANPRAITNEVKVVEDIPHTNSVHSMGQIVVAPDGTIWFAMGDDGNAGFADPNALRAQDVNQPYGKLFHVNPNGTGVGTNPFFDATAPSSWRSRVFAYGFRNPFRFTFHPDGTMYLGDVGWNDMEEIDVIRPGGNYGWPCWEGTFQPPAWQQEHACAALYAHGNVEVPLWAYAHPERGSSSVTGGAFAGAGAYPEPYANSYVFADYVEHKMWTLETDASHRLVRAPESAGDRTNGAFGRNAGGPVAFRRAPNGEIHYAEIFSGQVFRLRHSAGNTPPTARGSADTAFGNPRVAFRGDESSDPDGDSITYEWDFGDGSPRSTLANPVHDYPSAGRFTATLRVRDAAGAVGTATIPVVLDDHEPQLVLTTPSSDARYAVGEAIVLTATASDAEDADVGPEDVQWRADMVHCRDSTCHTHPGAASTGAQFTMLFPDHGADSFMRIVARVQDSVGHVETRTYEALPRIRTLTVTGSTPAAELSVNGQPVPPDGRVPVVVGARTFVKAGGGIGVTFERWTDGSLDRERTYTMPPTDSSLRADYRAISVGVALSPGSLTRAVNVHVSAHGRVGDSYDRLSADVCTMGKPIGGDDGDGRLEVGETLVVPCRLHTGVYPDVLTVRVSAHGLAGSVAPGEASMRLGRGYRFAAADGGIFSFGDAPFRGSMGGTPLNRPVVGMASTPAGNGYWLVANDGGIFAFGDAGFFGSTGGQPIPAPIVAMAPTPTGEGYWLVGADGSVYNFGDAPDVGSLQGIQLNRPIVGIAAGTSGRGFWLVASDGGIFAFGDASFHGSMGGTPLNRPVVGIAVTPGGGGYWLVASDGGIFAFGDASFHGSMGGTPLNLPVVGMAASPSGVGYWMVGADGGIFAFGDATFHGSMGGTPLNQPVVAMTVGSLAPMG